jgi:membrane-bound serine protease (ClpP class)
MNANQTPVRLCRLVAGLAAMLIALLMLGPAPARAQGGGPIYTLNLDGVLTSVGVDLARRALRQAEAADASALVIMLRSEGAVLASVRPLANDMALAQVPVALYIAPEVQSGAAGALLLSAADIAAMGPGSSFGSATPLARVDELLSEQSQSLVLDSVSQQLSDWNARRGRSTEWVARAVREGAILSSEQATATTPPAVDVVAADEAQLLTLLEGRNVTLSNDQERVIHTLGRETEPIAPTLWEQLWLLLSTPGVAFALLVMGAAAVFAELSNPGTTVFLGIGGVLLALAFVGLASLPIRWPALVAILLAFGLMIADLYVNTHGGLSVAGIALLAIGALSLIDPDQAPGAGVPVWLVAAVSAGTALMVAVGIVLLVRTRAQPARTGSEAMVGQLAEVRQRLAPEGMVFIEGALWRAISENGEAGPGELVEVTAVHNLQLLVRRSEA